MAKNCQPISREILQTPSPWVQLARIKYYDENDQEQVRDLLLETGAHGVYVVAVTDDGHIILIRQYRASHGYQWEMPAGRLKDGQTARVAALDELSEETGYQAETMIQLAEGTPLSGSSTQRITIYLALGLHFAGQHPEPSEGLIGIALVKWEEARNFIIGVTKNGQGDLKMLTALDLAKDYLQRSPTEYVKFWLKIRIERLKSRYNQLKQGIEQKIKKEKGNVTTAKI